MSTTARTGPTLAALGRYLVSNARHAVLVVGVVLIGDALAVAGELQAWVTSWGADVSDPVAWRELWDGHVRPSLVEVVGGLGALIVLPSLTRTGDVLRALRGNAAGARAQAEAAADDLDDLLGERP